MSKDTDINMEICDSVVIRWRPCLTLAKQMNEEMQAEPRRRQVVRGSYKGLTLALPLTWTTNHKVE